MDMKTKTKNTPKAKEIKSKAKKTKRTSKTKKEVRSVELRNVILSKESRKSLRKIKNCLWGNVKNAIEGGTWHIPCDSYEFLDIKTEFENGMYDFFKLPEDAVVEVDCFDTGILSFEKGVYPKYHK